MTVSSTTVRSGVPSKSPKVYNPSAPLTPNDEFEVTLDNTTKQFLLKCRGKGVLKLAFASGETANNFITIERYSSLSQTLLEVAGLKLYLSCDVASEVIEILQWS